MKEMDSQSKLSLKLQAYQYLKTKILNCEYRPNEFLNEQKLCAEMGNISRTPMRDALGRLEQEGLITILPKKGLMVSGITEEDVHSMFEMRLLVEPYALRTYGNLPLIEPLESREVKKIRDFVIVVDTSESTAGELVKAFLKETFTLLKSQDSFFRQCRILVMQADNAVRDEVWLNDLDALDRYTAQFTLVGGGGTDFRPAFAYVDQLCAEKKFANLRGLLYFTDGMGTYPAKRPAYDTAFLFLGERFDDANVPPWAMKVVLDEEEFAGPAARSALHCLGQRVQASGTATEMFLGIISKSFAKDLTELLLFIIPFMIWNVVYYDRILYIMQKYYISDGGCHAHRKRGDPGSFEISLPAGTGLPLAGGRCQ